MEEGGGGRKIMKRDPRDSLGGELDGVVRACESLRGLGSSSFVEGLLTLRRSLSDR